MARHEPNIRAAVPVELGSDELLSLLRDAGGLSEADRQEAIACYLSGSKGWDEAAHRLGGAFAPSAARLRRRKAD